MQDWEINFSPISMRGNMIYLPSMIWKSNTDHREYEGYETHIRESRTRVINKVLEGKETLTFYYEDDEGENIYEEISEDLRNDIVAAQKRVEERIIRENSPKFKDPELEKIISYIKDAYDRQKEEVSKNESMKDYAKRISNIFFVISTSIL